MAKDKQTTRKNKDIVFPVQKGYEFDTNGAIEIARQISIIQEMEEKN